MKHDETSNLWHYIENITTYYKQREDVFCQHINIQSQQCQQCCSKQGVYMFETSVWVPQFRVSSSANAFHSMCVCVPSIIFYK